jgi:SAM-dependent methyltransferase
MTPTTTTDPFAEFKAKQREGWAHFAPIEAQTTPTAARLIRFSGVKAGDRVLDVGCGTGVVAITAARLGAKVTGLDLTPELLARAKEHTTLLGLDITWREGDAENLPFEDSSFDVVLSQFGHMFAPRPEVALGEMLRVLKSGGRIAFSTWPPDQMIGRMFGLVSKYIPPPPGASPPGQWGEPTIVRERLGAAVRDLHFDRDFMVFGALSPQHQRDHMEHTSGPVLKLVQQFASDPAKLAEFRKELDGVATDFFFENQIRSSYLMTRATKV